MLRTDRLILWICLALLLPASLARGASVVQLTPEEVLANADVIFDGTVLSATPRWRTRVGGNIVTDYVIRVDDVIEDRVGTLATRRKPDGTVVLTFTGGTIGEEGRVMPGMPEFAVGDRCFFFTGKDFINTMCPTIGWWQGVMRVGAAPGGRQVVRHAGSCCAPGALVTRHYFAKVQTAPEGFTPAEFAAEVRRALPEAKGSPALSLERVLGRADLVADGLVHACVAGDAGAAGSVATPTPAAPAPVVVLPAFAERMLPESSADVTLVSRPLSNRFGFSNTSPSATVAFNIPPVMGAFGGVFDDQLAYWNTFIGDSLFRIYDNPNNSMGTNNSRYETGFLDNAGLDALDYDPWGATTNGFCQPWTRGGRIVEADIVFNPGRPFTNDYMDAQNNLLANVDRVPFYRTALHEIGHAFGLRHQWEPNPNAQFPSIMNYYPRDIGHQVNAVYGDDAAAIRSAYDPDTVFTELTIALWSNTGSLSGGNNGTAHTIAQNTSVQRGTNLAVGSGSTFFTVDNPGMNSVLTKADFFLCPAHGSFDGSVYCGSHWLPVISPGGSARLQRSVPVPAATVPGQYFLGVVLQPENDQFPHNNVAWSHFPLTVTAGRPSNDDSWFAAALDPINSSVVGTTFGATPSNYGACGTSTASPDVWYVFTAPFDGQLRLDTCGSGYDTVLELYAGSSAAPSAFCDDDDDSNQGPCRTTQIRASFMSRPVTSGTRYWVRVSGYNTASGDYRLSARLIPFNDTCDRPHPNFPQLFIPTVVLPSSGGVVAGTTIGAERTPAGDVAPCPVFAGQTVDVEHRPDVWYNWTAPCTGSVHIRVNTNEDLNPQVSVYDFCPSFFISGPPPMLMCGWLSGPGQAEGSLAVTAGERYAIRVNTNTLGADFLMSLTHSCPPPNDTPAGADGPAERIEPERDAPASRVANTASAQPTPGLPIPAGAIPGVGQFDMGPDLWYRMDVQSTGLLKVTRCNGSFLPVVALYVNTPGPGDPPTDVGYSDSSSCAPVIITRGVIQGESYLVRVGGNPNGPGSLTGQSEITFAITVPTVTGACCFPDGSCSSSPSFDCAGSYQGDGTACDPTPCWQPSGACCTGSACGVMTEADCAGAGGTFLGISSPCVDEPGNPITCCPANTNRLGGVDVGDIFGFLSLWFSHDPAADLDGSGNTEVGDIFLFLSSWFAGC